MAGKLGFQLLCSALYGIVRLLNLTYRYHYVGLPHRKAAEAHHGKGAIVLGTWHKNCFAGILGHAGERFAPLMSLSKDGDLVAFMCRRLGLKPIRGSSSRGGAQARSEIVEHFDTGYSSAITVDGPKGPPHEVKMGIVDVAKTGQVAIVPLCARANRYWELNSWDRFRIPKPFARVVIGYGEPIYVPSDLAREDHPKIAADLAERLNRLEDLPFFVERPSLENPEDGDEAFEVADPSQLTKT